MECLAPQNAWHGKQTRDLEYSHRFSCGNCVNCLKKRAASWSFRLQQEMKVSGNAAFITLTYADDNLTYGSEHPTLVKRDLQLFFKRLRKNCKKFYDHKVENELPIKYYACGEYGEKTFRPHYHAIIFNYPNAYQESPQYFANDWKLGHIKVLPVTPHSIAYVTGYVIKDRLTQIEADSIGIQREFALMSQGLGKNFLSEEMIQYIKQKEVRTVRSNHGVITLPKYYKDKVWQYTTKEQREYFGALGKLRGKAKADYIKETLPPAESDLLEVLREQRKKTAQTLAAVEKYEPLEFRDENHRIQWQKQQIRSAEKNRKRGF